MPARYRRVACRGSCARLRDAAKVRDDRRRVGPRKRADDRAEPRHVEAHLAQQVIGRRPRPPGAAIGIEKRLHPHRAVERDVEHLRQRPPRPARGEKRREDRRKRHGADIAPRRPGSVGEKIELVDLLGLGLNGAQQAEYDALRAELELLVGL